MSRKQHRIPDDDAQLADELAEVESQEADDAVVDDAMHGGNGMSGAQMGGANPGDFTAGNVGLGASLANFMNPDAGRANPDFAFMPDNVVQLEPPQPPPRPPKRSKTVDYVRRRVLREGVDVIELTATAKPGREIVCVKQLRPADGSAPTTIVIETRVVSPPGKGAVA